MLLPCEDYGTLGRGGDDDKTRNCRLSCSAHDLRCASVRLRPFSFFDIPMFQLPVRSTNSGSSSEAPSTFYQRHTETGLRWLWLALTELVRVLQHGEFVPFSRFRFGTKIETQVCHAPHLVGRVGKELTPLHAPETRSRIAIVAFMLEGYRMDPATKIFSFGDTRTAEKERGLDLRGLKANAAREHKILCWHLIGQRDAAQI
jgi:hypothetical protein